MLAIALADDVTPEERETAELVKAVRSSGNLGPLLTRLRGSNGGRERARDALLMLGELDLEVLVQVALDTLISDHVDRGGQAPSGDGTGRRASSGHPRRG